ncbi:MAG TPA: hypothetical protein PKG67_10065 [Turneriella sp.]|nr:hypothetical protein [Turneriella sp.]HNN00790.1 hypothetical protein [Turneriella sp.]
MRVDLYPELIDILRSAGKLIGSRNFFLWRGSEEPDPAGIDLSFRPVIAEKVVERALDKNACVLCARRISYKKGQFEATQPVEPYLFLVHNDFLGPRAGYYNKPEENTLFEKMIEGVLGFSATNLLVREILRCHFSKEDTGDTAALAHCATHLRQDIERASIRGIVLVGQAASFVFRDKAELADKQGKVFEWNGVRTIVLPGPNRLVYMREKGFPREQIDAERKKIFELLTMFKEKIIGAQA